MGKKAFNSMIAGMSLLVVVAGLNEYLGNTRVENNVVYQGYNADRGIGVERLVFDEKSLTERHGDPELRVIGNSRDFKIGDQYDIIIKSSKWFGEDHIIRFYNQIKKK